MKIKSLYIDKAAHKFVVEISKKSGNVYFYIYKDLSGCGFTYCEEKLSEYLEIIALILKEKKSIELKFNIDITNII